MNCVIYLRVSTKEQAQKGDSKEGYSIPAQREACARYIREKGWNLIDEYVDRGESARSAHRPQLQHLLSRVRKQKDVQVVVVHKIDRLARNMEDHVAIKIILKKAGVSLVSVVENIEDTASGRLIEGIHALMAEFYSANLGMETKKGMVQKAKRGGWPEMAPLGYKNVQNNMGGRLVRTIEVDEEKAPLIRQAFELYATGDYSISELTDEMFRRGLRSKGNRRHPSGRVHRSNLAKILQTPFYKGTVVWDGLVSEGIHQPLVSKDLYERVQEVLKIHNLAGERKRKHPHHLRGTVYCGECGSRMSSLTAKNEYLYFYCLGQKRHNGCRQKYILADDLEGAIEKCYVRIQLPPDVIARLAKDFEAQLLSRESSTIDEQHFITRRMARLADQRKKLMEAYYAQAVSIDVLKDEQARITAELDGCQSRLEVLKEGDADVKLVLEIALSMASRCSEAYKKASPQARRMFNQAFFKKVLIKDKKISELHYTDLFAALFDPSLNKAQLVAGAGFEPATFGL